MPNAIFYSNTAVTTSLAGNISAGATSVPVLAATGFPTSFPYVLALDADTATEELILVSNASGATLSPVTRGYGGTSAQSHSIGATVVHKYNAQDATDFRTHEAAVGAVHGLTGNIVGTSDTQTLGNKTLTSPTINGGALSGTFTGAPTFSGAVALSGGGSLAGTFTGTPTFSGNVTFSGATTALTASGEIAHSNLYRGSRPNATDGQLEARVTGDASARWYVRADGLQSWGVGTPTDTNLYRQGVATLRTDSSLQVGGSLTVGGVGGVLNARKTADQQVFSNTTVADDVHLSVTVVANAVYSLEGAFMLYAAVAGTGGWKGCIVGPAGTTGYWSLVGPASNSTTDPDQVRTIGTPIGTATRSYGISLNGEVMVLPLQGMLETTAAGVVKLQWAQLSSAASGTTLKQYSWMRLTRVA